ncbi:hypothetical protein [uncultured Thiodictyon sp.]|uniref:hypothetical protein n=1 Tax=uncultured Thiodictyon sp. TaxID=1846217 RepID=UPI0025D7C715|nr:hypothetical protein [uncultured Thiodictyon sp.]
MRTRPGCWLMGRDCDEGPPADPGRDILDRHHRPRLADERRVRLGVGRGGT